MGEVRLIVTLVRKGGDLGYHVIQRWHTRATMPARVQYFAVGYPIPEVLGSDSASDTITVSGLGMRPLLAAMLPLEAVIVELASKRDPGWIGAVTEDLEGRDS